MEMEQVYFEFLNDLRESGKTNMFGASLYLEEAFDLNRREAKTVLMNWMKQFNRSSNS